MRPFTRGSLRYSTTPSPVTPYQAAAQQWDERIGSARVQARNWRLMAVALLMLLLFMVVIVAWQSSRSSITPYVVEVNQLGEVRTVGPAAEAYRPTDAQIAYHLERFIINVRSIPLDPIVLRQQWLDAYAFVTDRGATTLNEYARTQDPFARVGQNSITAEVTSVVRASENSYQLRWLERSYIGGASAGEERWTAILTIVLRTPRDEQRLRKNPLGIYIDGLHWTRELSAGK
jgi:type IV secretion system protein TrbF